MSNESNALNQAHAKMASIREMVAALECDYDRLEELREARDDFASDVDGGAAIRAAHELWAEENPEDAEELVELEELAGDCSDREEAEQRILEDALSVEVREDWHAAGDTCADPSEFRILLCTGGPHVQIRGELSQCEPSRAWLEYSDWFTGLTERVNRPGDMEALLSYARCFWFGE